MLSEMFDLDLVKPDTIRPISRKAFDQLVELGMFDDDERVELLRGMLVTMSKQGWHHAATIVWLNERLVRSIDPSLEVRPQLAFAASDWSEPQPDFAIVRKDDSLREHPQAALLVIEVSDSSLRKDRKLKLGIYAEAGVPEYWIVNLQEMTVEVYTQPSESGYAHKQILHDGDVLRPTLVPGVEIAVADLPR